MANLSAQAKLRVCNLKYNHLLRELKRFEPLALRLRAPPEKVGDAAPRGDYRHADLALVLLRDDLAKRHNHDVVKFV